jgi:hypothetical protein
VCCVADLRALPKNKLHVVLKIKKLKKIKRSERSTLTQPFPECLIIHHVRDGVEGDVIKVPIFSSGDKEKDKKKRVEINDIAFAYVQNG